jgi:hypothetical protein
VNERWQIEKRQRLKNKRKEKNMSTKETTQNKINGQAPSLSGSPCFSRKNPFRFGIFLVIIGLAWLGVKTGYLPAEWLHSELFWPSVVTFIGSWIVVKSVIRRKHHFKSY